jgi:hypothetical protein
MLSAGLAVALLLSPARVASAGVPVNELALERVDGTTPQVGDVFALELRMRDMAQLVNGWQAFLAYDPADMSFRADLSAYTNAPFEIHFTSMGLAEGTPGEIDLDGLTFTPTDADALLATLYFEVTQTCADLQVIFRDATPFETQFSSGGMSVPAFTLDAPLEFGGCDDGLFCNGAETCDASGQCVAGTDPCAEGEQCIEAEQRCVLANGDFDADGDVDLFDTAVFQVCFGQPATGLCATGNLAGGTTIDAHDYALFAAALTGP